MLDRFFHVGISNLSLDNISTPNTPKQTVPIEKSLGLWDRFKAWCNSFSKQSTPKPLADRVIPHPAPSLADSNSTALFLTGEPASDQILPAPTPSDLKIARRNAQLNTLTSRVERISPSKRLSSTVAAQIHAAELKARARYVDNGNARLDEYDHRNGIRHEKTASVTSS